jgi:hypothetical protein
VGQHAIALVNQGEFHSGVVGVTISPDGVVEIHAAPADLIKTPPLLPDWF